MNPQDMMSGDPQPGEPLLTILTDLQTSLLGTIYEGPYGVETFILHMVAFLTRSQAAVNEPLPAAQKADPFRFFYGGSIDADEDTSQATIQVDCKLPFPEPIAAGGGGPALPIISGFSVPSVVLGESFTIFGVNFQELQSVGFAGGLDWTLEDIMGEWKQLLVTPTETGTTNVRVVTATGSTDSDDEFTVDEPVQP